MKKIAEKARLFLNASCIQCHAPPTLVTPRKGYKTCTKNLIYLGGSPCLVVMGGDSVSKVVSSNPGTLHWKDIFPIPYSCKICTGFEKKK